MGCVWEDMRFEGHPAACVACAVLTNVSRDVHDEVVTTVQHDHRRVGFVVPARVSNYIMWLSLVRKEGLSQLDKHNLRPEMAPTCMQINANELNVLIST